MKKEKLTLICYRLLFPAILLLYPLRNAAVGADLSDTMYNLANFMFPQQQGGLFFSTYLANAGGAFIMDYLPMGDTMLGMNVYTGLVISAMALASYFFFCRLLHPAVAFAGELLAVSLCWCPSVILYNYLTYLLFLAACLLLYKGLVQEKKLYFAFAGAALGVNVFVRFPNLLEAGLILCVWYYAFLKRKKWNVVLRETGICLGGFMAGIAGMLLWISIRYGMDLYLAMLGNLFAVGSGEAGYSPLDMIFSILRAYRDAGIWLLWLLAYTAAGMVLFRIGKGKLLKTKTAVFAAGSLFLLKILYAKGMFNFNYRGDYLSMFQWVAIFLMAAIGYSVFLLADKRAGNGQKLLASMVLAVIFITPLGSNNYLYPNINFLFLIAPFLLNAIISLIRGRTVLSLAAVRIMTAVFTAVLFGQSILFGSSFVLRGGETDVPWDSRIEGNEVLKGMKTSQLRRDAIEGLTAYVRSEGLSDRQVILYGYIPGVSYFLEMPCAVSTTYPDMESYSLESWKKELTDAMKMTKIGNNVKPLIIVNTQTAASASEEKAKTLFDFMEKEQYAESFSNALFTVYQ